MQETTTIAATLKQIFSKLNEVLPTTNNGVSLFTCWNKAFGEERDEFDTIETINHVLSALRKLESQIKNSKDLDSIDKGSSLTTVSGFKPLFSLQNQTQPAFNFKQICHPGNLGNLGMIGRGLKNEFSEPKFTQEDIGIITSSLNELKQLISDSSIPLDLRLSLDRHITTILWWLARPDFINVQDLAEQAGAAIVVARQIEGRSSKESPEKAQKGKEVASKMKGVLGAIAKVMSFTVSHADDFEKIEHTVTALLPTSSSS